MRYYRHHHYRWRAASHAARDGSGIKPGQWQFTSELLAPVPASGTQSSAPASKLAAAQPQAKAPAAGGAKSVYMACITSDKAVPAGIDPRCKLDGTQRQGSRISWSMSCANTHVRSDGVAQYHGDTMDGTMISHVPNASGAAMDLTQHITGNYVGPCTQSAQIQMPPAPNEAGSSQPQAEQSGPAPEGTASQAAGRENAAAAAPPRERQARHHARYRHYARHHHRRHYWRWY